MPPTRASPPSGNGKSSRRDAKRNAATRFRQFRCTSSRPVAAKETDCRGKTMSFFTPIVPGSLNAMPQLLDI